MAHNVLSALVIVTNFAPTLFKNWRQDAVRELDLDSFKVMMGRQDNNFRDFDTLREDIWVYIARLWPAELKTTFEFRGARHTESVQFRPARR